MRPALIAITVLALTACSSDTAAHDPVDEVIDRISLPLPNQRDNTTGMCVDDMPCTKWITTDRGSFVHWDTPEDAQHWAELRPDVIVVDQVVTIDFTDADSVDRDAYIEQATRRSNTGGG